MRESDAFGEVDSVTPLGRLRESVPDQFDHQFEHQPPKDHQESKSNNFQRETRQDHCPKFGFEVRDVL